MRLSWTPEFSADVRRYDLRYRCPDCAYYLGDRCAHEWPLEDHLATHDAASPAVEVVFCKEFELR